MHHPPPRIPRAAMQEAEAVRHHPPEMRQGGLRSPAPRAAAAGGRGATAGYAPAGGRRGGGESGRGNSEELAVRQQRREPGARGMMRSPQRKGRGLPGSPSSAPRTTVIGGPSAATPASLSRFQGQRLEGAIASFPSPKFSRRALRSFAGWVVGRPSRSCGACPC